MKRYYLIILLALLFVLQAKVGFADTFNQVSSSCADVFKVENYPSGPNPDKIEVVNDSLVKGNDFLILEITIPDADYIQFIINPTIENGDKLIIKETVSGASLVEITGGLSVARTVYSTTNKVTISYQNASNSYSEFEVSWQGIFASQNTLKHNCTTTLNEGTAEIEALGGTDPYAYKWSDGSTAYKRTSLAPNTYNYSITDANGCKAIDTIKILKPTANLSANVLDIKHACYGEANGEAALVGLGGYPGLSGYDYKWHDGITDTARADLGKGTFSYTISDTANCTYSSSFSITQPTSALTAVASVANDISCNSLNTGPHDDGSVRVATSGGYTISSYSWSKDGGVPFSTDQTPIGLTLGDFKCVVTDDHGCVATSNTLALTEPSQLSATASLDKDISCNVANGDNSDGQISVLATGGSGSYINYNWSNGDTGGLASGLDQDSYSCIVEDSKHCFATSNSESTTEPSEITLTTLDKADYNGFAVSCYGANDGWIKLVAAGGTGALDYSWGPNGNYQVTDSAILLKANTYNYTVTDDNNCELTGSETIHSPGSIVIEGTVSDVTYTNGNDGAITITSLSNMVVDTTAQWSGSDIANPLLLNQTGLKSGFFMLDVEDANHCTASKSFTVLEPSSTNGGTITLTENNYICHTAQTDKNFTNSVLAFGGLPADYSWQHSPDAIHWTTISGATSADFTFQPGDTVTQNIYIRRVASNATSTGYSNEIMLEYVAETPLTIYNLESAYCENRDSVLIVGVPFNNKGSFGTLDGVVDKGNGTAYFKPWLTDTSSVNPIPVTYNYTNKGCISTDTIKVRIYPKTVPSFTIGDKYSDRTDSVNIENITPLKGIFTGASIVATDSTAKFFPKKLTAGSYPITYTFKNSYGCSATYSKTVQVVSGSGNIFYANTGAVRTKYCIDGDTVYLKAAADYIVDSGKFENSFITRVDSINGKFLPIDAGGTNTDTVIDIIYSYYNVGVKYTITLPISIYNVKGKAVIKDLAPKYCQYGQTVTINANSLTSGEKGKYFGSDGLSSTTNNITLDIDNLTASTFGGIPDTLTYVYYHSDLESNCTDTTTETFWVYALDAVSFDIKDLFNVDETAVQITNIIPEEATFTGGGIIPGKKYDPKIAGQGTDQINIFYKSPDTGCENNDSKTVEVDTARGSFNISANKIYCYNGEPDTIVVTPLNAGTAAGSFTIDDTPSGIVSIGVDSIVIYPKLLTPSVNASDKRTITYTYKGIDNATEFKLTTKVLIDDLGEIGISGLKDEYCISDLPVSIKGTVKGANSSFGDFESSAAVSNGTPNDGIASFSPSAALVGNEDIVFIYPSQLVGSTCSDTATKTVIVHALPVLSFDMPAIYNQHAKVDTLSHYATPITGGSFSFTGNGIVNIPVGAFDPGTFTSNTSSNITFTYTDASTQCTNALADVTEIQFAQGTINGVAEGQVFCYGSASVPLSVTGTNTGSQIGTYSGYGLVDNHDGTATLNPKLAFDQTGSTSGELTTTIVYTYEVLKDGDLATFELSRTYKINNLTNITFNIAPKDTSVCKDEGIISLTNTVNVTGGQFYIQNSPTDILLNNNEFNPSTQTAGLNIILFKYNGGSCATQLQDSIHLYSLPEPDFNFVSKMCENDSIILTGHPRGGKFEGQTFKLLNNMVDSVQFTARSAEGGNYEFRYYYKAPVSGCEATKIKTIPIYNNPLLTFSDNFVDEFCVNGDSIAIFGKNNNNQVSTGLFSGDSINDVSDNGSYQFKPIIYKPGKYKVKFSYIDNNACASEVSKEITINALPSVSIIGFDRDNYCGYESESSIITCAPSYNGSAGDGLKINGVLFPKSQEVFYPKDYNQSSDVEFIYIHTDVKGCTNKDTVNVHINNLPISNFDVQNKCISDPIEFEYTGGTPENATFLWKFGVNSDSSLLMNPKYRYTEEGTYPVELTVKNTDGCEDTKLEQLKLDFGPTADFNWSYECLGATLQFHNLTDKDLNNWKWVIEGQTQSVKDPTHEFKTEGEYKVTLTAIESDKCKDEVTKIVSIRPVIKVDEANQYESSFEDNFTGWAAELINNSDSITWENTMPAGTIINSTYEGSKAWVTNAIGNYKNYEQSAITSPCFDVSLLQRPMIDLWYWAAVKENDGAVLQYRIEGDANWQTIGTINNGIDWYNSYEINGQPGGSSQGWTGNSETWKHAMHDLNALKGINDLVRFRVAFGADQSSVSEGFAFDNIKIGERPRRVLLEHFTNTEASGSLNKDADVNQIVGRYPLDVIDIQYHTSTPSGDKFYVNYPAGSSVRASYYNIMQVPYAMLNGETQFDYSLDQTVKANQLLNIAMVNPEFSMSINCSKSSNILTINQTIEPTLNIVNRQLHLVTAIVEKEVAISGSEVVYENVLRGFVPNASGEYLSNNWNAGAAQDFTFNYTIGDFVKDANQLNVIAFIQDEISHEILQVVTTDTTSVSTAIGQLFANGSSFDFMIYPNPAGKQTNILLSEATNADAVIRIYDRQGALVDRLDLLAGIQLMPIDISKYAEGIYMISIVSGNKQAVKKLVILP